MEFNDIQKIKRQFFAYRNGVTADALRKGGSPFHIIFGLSISQLNEIASHIGYNRELALKLWENNTTRCSMLLAPMLLDPSITEPDVLIKMCRETPDVETADILCHKLISHSPHVDQLLSVLTKGTTIEKYISLRLIQRLMRKNENYYIKNKEIIRIAESAERTYLRELAYQIEIERELNGYK